MNENIEFVICPICKKKFKQITNKHFNIHGMTKDVFIKQYPNQILICKKSLDKKILAGKSTNNKQIGKLRSDKNKNNYNINPKFCLFCKTTILYENRNNIFCDHHCAAKYNNENRITKIKVKNICLNCGNECVKSYCCSKCQQDYKHKQKILLWKKDSNNIIMKSYKISSTIKRYLLEKYNNKCAKCGWSEVNIYSGNIPLEVEHIDGNHKNNNEDNLTILCPNCHSLTSTYKNLNRGNGRHSRMNRYINKESY